MKESHAVLERFGLAKGKIGNPGKALPLWFVLRANGKPTGAACLLLDDGNARLVDIALLPEARGKNQGTAFMGHIVEALRQRGIQKLRASTRLTLKRFFARLGFQPDGDCFYADNALHMPVSCRIAA
ncbi:MAG: GNAT family N-acetyltransferase [Alphaproteobacteria bacterium]|nr:GNAT family N-acetyltransferase [Alphaproteobacteria bacterium]